ncbi:Exportin-2 [Kappamyces sp. JEL0680]|nr:Exportin-2 [Kappamyces sp. JEL0680]
MMQRIFQSKTAKFTKHFLDFFVYIILLDKPGLSIDDIAAILESVNKDLFAGLMQNIVIPEFASIHSIADRKNTAVAMTRVLTQSQAMVTIGQAQWPKLLSGLLNLFNLSLANETFDEVDAAIDLEEAGYQPSFARLTASVSKKVDANIDPETYLLQNLAQAMRTNPQMEGWIQNGLEASQAAALLQKLRGSVAAVQR